MVKDFVPCDLPRGKDGSVEEYFAKTTGYGYNDMISLPTLTKDSILENLKRRFKVWNPLMIIYRYARSLL